MQNKRTVVLHVVPFSSLSRNRTLSSVPLEKKEHARASHQERAHDNPIHWEWTLEWKIRFGKIHIFTSTKLDFNAASTPK